MQEFQHKPVLMDAVLRYMQVERGGTYIDCTLGGAGHSKAMLHANPNIHLWGIDQDQEALSHARNVLAAFETDVHFVHSNFSNLAAIARDNRIDNIQGILMDIGVSSYQLDQGDRGFSYQQDALLDMRMDASGDLTAETLINSESQERLAEIIRRYGEERWASRIAQFIIEYRTSERIRTTGQLVEIIKAAIPAGARRSGPHPAKRTFQALRIAVNRELDVLQEALEQSMEILQPGGRLVVITFHSLEDRIVKEFLKGQAAGCICPPALPICRCGQKPTTKILTRKPISPTSEELEENPRARSAKLRAAEKL